MVNYYNNNYNNDFYSQKNKTSLTDKLKNVKDYISNPKQVWSDTIDVLRTTSIEVYVGIALGVAVGLTTSIQNENKRAEKYPIGFSHRESLKNEGPISIYYSMTNDAVMKGLECWNEANKDATVFSNVKHQFAFYLDTKTDITMKQYQYELYQYLEWLPKVCDDALKELNLEKSSLNLAGISTNFDNAWDRSYHDNTHEDCDTDSEGHETCTTVYDDTDYKFKYFREYGEDASLTLDAQLKETPQIQMNEIIILPKSTDGAYGDYAAEKSRDLKKGEKLSQEDYLKIAQTWWNGSTLKTNLPIIQSNYQLLFADANSWRMMKRTAHTDTYNKDDEWHNWPGPAEYQSAQKALNDVDATRAAIDEVIEGIKYTKETVPKLQALAKDIVAIEVFLSKKGNSRKLERQFMRDLKTVYTKNYNSGFDMDRFRIEMILAYALLGGLLGGAIGAGVNYLGDRFNLYGKNNKTNFY
jgi:hypothetical protein